MQFVRQGITNFVSTTLTDSYAEWSSTTTYNFEATDPSTSIVRYGNYYYRSLINNNLNFNPVEYENVKWVKYGISNKFAMLDLSSSSKSVSSANIVVVFEQNKADTIGIGYYSAEYITIEIMTDLNTVVWTGSIPSPLNSGVTNWYNYIYSPYNYESNKSVKVSLPVLGTYVRVTIHKSGNEDTSCGFLVAGTAVDMGKTLAKVKFGYTSYADKKFDDFGTLSLTKRGVQELVDFETIIEANSIQTFRRKLKDVYNDVVMFVLDERDNSRYENLISLAIIQDAGTVLSDFQKSIMTFSIKEVI